MHRIIPCQFILNVLIIITCLQFSQLAYSEEIYNCLDKRGNYIFSDSPCRNQFKQFDIEAENVLSELKSLVALGRGMALDQSSNVKSIVACRNTQKKLSSQLEGLRDRVDSVSQRHHRLVSAYRQVQQCLGCGGAAAYNCSSADAKLNGALDQFRKR